MKSLKYVDPWTAEEPVAAELPAWKREAILYALLADTLYQEQKAIDSGIRNR